MDSQLEGSLVGVTHALMGDGELIDTGCSQEDIDDVIKQANKINPNKKFRVVSDWRWWDIKFPNNLHTNVVKILEDRSQLPSLIYSSNLLVDSSGEFDPGFCVRSTFLVKLYHGCIFETGNTFYILVGQGNRKTVDAESAFSIYF